MTMKRSVRLMLKGLKIDDRTEAYIQKRLGTIKKLVDNLLRTEVEVSQDKKGKFRVEVMAKTPYQLYRAEETTESIEGSVDKVEDEIKDQIRKDKEKIRTLKKRGRLSLKKKMVISKDARFRK